MALSVVATERLDAEPSIAAPVPSSAVADSSAIDPLDDPDGVLLFGDDDAGGSSAGIEESAALAASASSSASITRGKRLALLRAHAQETRAAAKASAAVSRRGTRTAAASVGAPVSLVAE